MLGGTEEHSPAAGRTHMARAALAGDTPEERRTVVGHHIAEEGERHTVVEGEHRMIAGEEHRIAAARHTGLAGQGNRKAAAARNLAEEALAVDDSIG